MHRNGLYAESESHERRALNGEMVKDSWAGIIWKVARVPRVRVGLPVELPEVVWVVALTARIIPALTHCASPNGADCVPRT
jgi:hypothetical protein